MAAESAAVLRGETVPADASSDMDGKENNKWIIS